MRENRYIEKVKTRESTLFKDIRPVLNRLDLELTERCSNNCIHCCINLPADDIEIKKRELSTNDVCSIIEEAAGLGCLTVRITGGEPLLREDFEEIYLFTRRRGMRVILFTNATLIDEHMAKIFTEVPPMGTVEVSVYGMEQESYEAVTGVDGSYRAAMRGISILRENKIPFLVKSAYLPQNKTELDLFESWAAEIPWMDGPPTISLFLHTRDRREREKSAAIRKLRVSPEEGLEVLTRRKSSYVDEMRTFCSRFLAPPGDRLFTCGAGVNGCCVDSYGTLQPCLPLRAPQTAYDLEEGSLEDAMKRFFPGMREMRASDPHYLERCARCFLKGLCEQCPAKSWFENGTLDTPDEYYCEVAHVQARFLGLLDEGEQAWEITDWGERIKR